MLLVPTANRASVDLVIGITGFESVNNESCSASYQEGHPSPGKPFHGGVFDAYLPDNETALRLLPRLEEAFKQGLTFTVAGKGAGSKVTWSYIPHKTSLHGGKSGWVKPLGTSELSRGVRGHVGPGDKRLLPVLFRCGYPDSTYLTRLADVLTTHGIEEPPATFK